MESFFISVYLCGVISYLILTLFVTTLCKQGAKHFEFKTVSWKSCSELTWNVLAILPRYQKHSECKTVKFSSKYFQQGQNNLV